MKIIKPTVELIDLYDPQTAMKHLEQRIRNCYKSEDKTTDDSYVRMLGKMIDSHHYSTLEHINFTAKFICSRACSHQIVRHRHGSYSQESQRYINYSRGKFGSEITVIQPFKIQTNTTAYVIWQKSVEDAERAYMELLNEDGVNAQDARSVLPNCAKTELDITMNPRAWRDFFELRCTPHAQDEVRFLAKELLKQLNDKYPPLFGDLAEKFLK